MCLKIKATDKKNLLNLREKYLHIDLICKSTASVCEKELQFLLDNICFKKVRSCSCD